MATLNRELTEKMFAVESTDELRELVNQFPDLNECSRMAIDEAMMKCFKRSCSGNKANAIEILLGELNNVHVEVKPISPDLHQIKSVKSVDTAPLIDAETRAEIVTTKLMELYVTTTNDFLRFKKANRAAGMKAIGLCEDDFIQFAKDNKNVVCGRDSSGQVYLMPYDKEEMKRISEKWGDTYFDK